MFWSRLASGDSERIEQLAGAQFHEPDFGRHLKQQKSLLHVAADQIGGRSGAAEVLAVTARGLDDARDGVVQWGLILFPAKAERERKIAGADEDGVDTWRGGNGVDVIE